MNLKKEVALALSAAAIYYGVLLYCTHTCKIPPIPEEQVISFWIPENALVVKSIPGIKGWIAYPNISLEGLKNKSLAEEKVILITYWKESFSPYRESDFDQPANIVYWLPTQGMILTYDFLGGLSSEKYKKNLPWIIKWFDLLPHKYLEYNLHSKYKDPSGMKLVYKLKKSGRPILRLGAIVHVFGFFLPIIVFIVRVSVYAVRTQAK